MKRLSILFVGLLSVVLVFSVVGLADEAARTFSNITFSSWIDLYLIDDLDDVEVVQQAGDGDGEGGEFVLRGAGDGQFSPGTVTVTVTSLFDYEVGASYYAPSESNGLVSLGTSTLPFFNSENYETWVNNTLDSISNSGTVSNNVLRIFGGGQNLGTPAENTYTLNIDLANLQNDYTGGEDLDIEIAFWAFEDGTI